MLYVTHTHTHTRNMDMNLCAWQYDRQYAHICSRKCMQANRHIIQKMDNVRVCKHTHTQLRQTCKWKPIGTKMRIPPLAREPILSITPTPPYPPDPCHTQSASQSSLTHTYTRTHTHTHTHLDCPCLFPTYHITPPTHCVCLSHASAHTHTETWRVPCLTPGPRRSLVWRPVCVCLASNGPFKCRIFTADRAILRDSHTEAWICFGSIILKEVILIIITQCHTDWQWVSVLWPSTRSLCSSCTALNRATRISFLLIVI